MPSKILLYTCDRQLRYNIIADNKCLQVNNFVYLGCEISYENEKGIQQTQAKFSQTTLLNQL